MSTTLSVSPSTQASIEECKKHLQMCKHRFQTTLSFVPDDKLTYSPAPTSKSALRIAAHTALSNYTFASIIRRDPRPEMSFPEMLAIMAEKEKAVTTRQEALDMLEASTAEVIAALDGITDETIKSEIPTPVFTAPMMFWMYLPARHIDNHASQIDYLQTMWGDMDWHMV